MTILIKSKFILVASALAVAGITAMPLAHADEAAGIRGALTQGANAAVSKLGVAGGFMNNAKVKIPLPEPMGGAYKLMKTVGMGKQADELVAKMNAAAEQAVPLAKPLLLDAVKSMSVADAKGILTGGDNSVTQFFQAKTQDNLKKAFLPSVQGAISKVGLAQQYNAIAAKAKPLGLVKGDAANIETYVTGKTLDGLYLLIGEEEKKIRQNPMGAVSSVVQAVFGALKK